MAVLPKPLGNSSKELDARRKRFARADAAKIVTLTPVKLQILEHIFTCRLLSLPQIASLMAVSDQSARRHIRELYDGGLVERMPVSRAALADPEEANDVTLLYGSAPNIHTISKLGLQRLVDGGIVGNEALRRPIPIYGPQNTLFLRHELMVRDVRVWLEQVVRDRPDRRKVLSWIDGEDAAIYIPKAKITVKPDARFLLQLDVMESGQPLILSGLVEVDRGTERGISRWSQKLCAYTSLFADRATLAAATGYVNARVIVITPNATRTNKLIRTLEVLSVEHKMDSESVESYWIAEKSILENPNTSDAKWSIPGIEGKLPLLSV
jgi:hypothetical protein